MSNEMKHLEDGIDPILDIAEKHYSNKNYITAINISAALLEEMTEAIQFCDDSSGTLGGIIDHSYQILHKIATSDIANTEKTTLFNYCIEAFEQKVFEDWEWHTGILDIAYELVTNEEQADVILECLETINGEYQKRRAQSFILKILTKYKDNKTIQNYIDKHITNSLIRKIVIEKAVENNEFENAIQLCKDGIQYDQKDKPGLIKDWYNWLLKIAQIQNNSLKIVEYSRFLFIDDFHSEQDYYQLLKEQIKPNEWNGFLEELLTEIAVKGGWMYKDLARKIFINEKWWDRLFLLLKQDLSLQTIEANEAYLSKEYSQELIELYRGCIVKYVDENMGRKHYQTACRYLRRMKKLGGNKKMLELTIILRNKYPQRRALLDELTRV